ncbi:MAG: hypothetical protein AB7N91_20150 [Candidatus Tectimicrobiota bacterium]
MPTLSRCFLKGALLSLAIGIVPGALILCQKGTGWFPGLWVLLPAHTYLVLIGGMSQFALGMCYWIFPRLAGKASRGNTTLAWMSYGLLNAAIALIVLHPLVDEFLGAVASRWAFTIAGVLQAGAALTFVLHIWPRIRPAEPVSRHMERRV